MAWPMSQSGDAKLKALAEKELAKPATSAEQVEVADGWWEMGVMADDELARWHLRKHAYLVYKESLPQLAGLSKAKVEKKLKELEAIAEKRLQPLEPSSSWFVLLHSDDASIWNKDIRVGNNFARPLDKIPGKVAYLKMTEAKSKDFVIIEMTKERLTKVTDDGRYGFEGTAHEGSGGRHLGVYDLQWPCQKGDICIRILPWFRGWGFGHISYVDTVQGYCWDGKAIDRTVFDIAVSPGPLTPAESKKLLKK